LDRSAVLAQHAKVTRARTLRLDGTCVQTTIHHPTDSGLLGDGVRVLSRLLHRVRRLQGDTAAEQQRSLYQQLLGVTRRTLHQAERVRQALATTWRDEPPPASSPASPPDRAAHRLLTQLDHFLPLVWQGIQQAQRRVLDGQPVPSAQKVLSLFERHTRVVKRGKIAAVVEFCRQVVVD
jgi:IS5 family transposase